MDLDSNEFSFEINICDTSSSDKFFKLGKHVITRNSPEIGKIDFRVFHYCKG